MFDPKFGIAKGGEVYRYFHTILLLSWKQAPQSFPCICFLVGHRHRNRSVRVVTRQVASKREVRDVNDQTLSSASTVQRSRNRETADRTQTYGTNGRFFALFKADEMLSSTVLKVFCKAALMK